MEDESKIYTHPGITDIAEYIENRLYFATLVEGRTEIESTPNIHFFSIDDELVYNKFYDDFGPLNLACLYKYCCKLSCKLKRSKMTGKPIVVQYTSKNQRKKANAAYLIASYAILYLKKSPEQAYQPLANVIGPELRPFQDASMGVSMYNIKIIDCLNAVHKAAAFGFFDFDDFDRNEYEKYGKMCHGDLNWTVPQKFIAFVGPSSEPGSVYHPPETYLEYFKNNGIVAVVRLNVKSYDSSKFTKAGIMHYDMFMPDGSVPPRRVLARFLQLAESTSGPIAVHCKAGLGRTGSLIAAYLVKHYQMSAREAIAWMRICRPGSVIGHQQAWLEDMEHTLWSAGQQYRLKHHGDGDIILHHKRGIYSLANKSGRRIDIPLAVKYPRSLRSNGNLVRMTTEHREPVELRHKVFSTKATMPNGLTHTLGKLRCVRDSASITYRKTFPESRKMKLENDESYFSTQGDRLNEIKINQQKLMVHSLFSSKNNASLPVQISSKRHLEK